MKEVNSMENIRKLEKGMMRLKESMTILEMIDICYIGETNTNESLELAIMNLERNLKDTYHIFYNAMYEKKEDSLNGGRYE